MPNKYTRTDWSHQDPDSPIIYYSQYDDKDEEWRRIEIFHSGERRYGDKNHQAPDDDVWIYGISYGEVMASDIADELVSVDITPDEFYQHWRTPDNPFF